MDSAALPVQEDSVTEATASIVIANDSTKSKTREHSVMKLVHIPAVHPDYYYSYAFESKPPEPPVETIKFMECCLDDFIHMEFASKFK